MPRRSHIPTTSATTPSLRAKGPRSPTERGRGRPLLPAGMPPLRGGPRPDRRLPRGGVPLQPARGRHREQRPAATAVSGADPGGRGRRGRGLRAGPRPRRGESQARYCGGMVEVIEEFDAAGAFPVEGERLSLGVAARLSRYLQVLTQARKMGRETISSQELSEYTHINPTQIRRDLSGFGKFGKRGVGYNVDSLVSEIRKILRTAGQHNIALFGAGHLGQAIASSAIFADHGFQVVAVFDVDEDKVGTEIGDVVVRPLDGELAKVVADEEVVVGVLAVPA